LKDALILEKAFEDEPDEGMKNRYAFYCAQSYKDAGISEKAIEWYKKCLTRSNWIQEKYYSSYMIGNLYKNINNMEEATKYWLKTSEYDSERIEGIVDLCEYYRSVGSNLLVNLLYHKFKGYSKNPSNKLFVFNDKYKDMLEYNNSICAYYVNDKQSGYECCKKILKNKVAPNNIITQTENNKNFYKDLMDADPETIVDKDIELVSSQCNVSREKARETLLKNNSDIIQSIIELMNAV
jgi:NACalpha-BTF3-like transcription factor